MKKTMDIKLWLSSKSMALNPVGVKKTHGFPFLKSKGNVNGNHNH